MDGTITEADLAEHGITVADVRRRCPLAVDRFDSDGNRYWLTEDVLQLFSVEAEEFP